VVKFPKGVKGLFPMGGIPHWGSEGITLTLLERITGGMKMFENQTN
jgi:hypothetical protein